MRTMNALNTVFIILAAGFATSGCSSSTDKASPSVSTQEADNRTEVVKIMNIDYRTISRSITYPANLQAFREVHLASASPGRIEKIHVETGYTVREGQLLVEMDKTQLQQAIVQLNNLETDYRRLDTLRKAGSISQQQFDQMKTQYDVLRSSVQFLRENTRLTAPFSGKVSGKYFEDGEMFSGAPNTPFGKAAILSLVQTNQLKALINVTETYYPNIKTGMPVYLNSDVYPEESFKGKIIHIYPTVDPATRTFTIELEVGNKDERLRPGMFTRATIELEKIKALVLPAIAVLKLQGSNERFVFLEKNGKAQRVIVELGERYDDMVEIITDDIKAGDKLIIAGQSRLLDGMEVSISQ